MDSETGLLRFVYVAVVATGGIFITVVLSGILSALLMVGAIELFFRANIHRAALSRYFGWRGSSRREQDDSLRILMQMDASTFYRLHYRQLCAQIAAAITSEGLRNEQSSYPTPLIDRLVHVSQTSRGDWPTEPPSSSEFSDEQKRYNLDAAMRQVDVIQAELGDEIGRAAFRYTCILWIIVYVAFFLGSAVKFKASLSSGVLEFAFQGFAFAFACVFALVIASILAIATAVFCAVFFNWFDRTMSAR